MELVKLRIEQKKNTKVSITDIGKMERSMVKGYSPILTMIHTQGGGNMGSVKEKALTLLSIQK